MHHASMDLKRNTEQKNSFNGPDGRSELPIGLEGRGEVDVETGEDSQASSAARNKGN